MATENGARLRVCVVGATGRMGSLIIREASSSGFEVTGAVVAEQDARLGQTLGQLGLTTTTTTSGELKLQSPSSLADLLSASDVCISFTRAGAEVENIPHIVRGGKPLVLGTTGFTESQFSTIREAVRGTIPAVIASNFSTGANMMFAMASELKGLPRDFDISVVEAHHAAKADAPSGTARTLGEAISRARGYTKTVYGRSGGAAAGRRTSEELEISSLRGGGNPGQHSVYAFGPYETLKFEHQVFSRSAFSQGALLAARWLTLEGRSAGIYSMLDVLGLRAQTA